MSTGKQLVPWLNVVSPGFGCLIRYKAELALHRQVAEFRSRDVLAAIISALDGGVAAPSTNAFRKCAGNHKFLEISTDSAPNFQVP